MPETRLILGEQVACTDGKCGALHTLVVKRGHAQVTHLVVEPEGRIGLGRLAPIDLVTASDDEVDLGCDLAAFNSLPLAESTEVVQDLTAGYIFLHSEVLPKTEVHEVLPAGEAGWQAATEVLATDGRVGVVGGVLTEGEDYEISALVVTEGRLLWGHKMLVIPVSAVAAFDSGTIQLNLAMVEVERVAAGFKG
jgi:hypothetical protein